MSWLPFLLVIFSAFCHAGWNFIGKKSVPYLSFFTMVSVFSAILFAPLAIVHHEVSQEILTHNLLWLVITGFFQAWYLLGLSGGYRSNDLSVVYPLARALPVALVPIAVSVLDRDHYQFWQYLGCALIIAGCLAIPFKSKAVFMQSIMSKGVLFAVIAALATTGYSYVDQQVLTNLAKAMPETQSWVRSLVYMCWLSLSSSVFVGLFSLCVSDTRYQWRITLSSQLKTALFTGAVMSLTYGLVLIAMNYVSHVGYVVALRQVSIPIGVAMGILWLGESFSRYKLMGLIAIMVGIMLVIEM
ncbi:EamA family transporter [Litoribacillus peritrichatus]|uniref:DMT family transporter n=1 Tax=Litoribacillus peritrichatus TaxID=718191 RepID=A0ABP7MCY7_9GAMM